MSNNTMLFALYRLGFHGRATVHGFRSVASTILNEMGWPADWIERQLAHDERDDVRGAYNSAQYLPGRRRMLQRWADWLDDVRASGTVVVLAREAAEQAKGIARIPSRIRRARCSRLHVRRS